MALGLSRDVSSLACGVRRRGAGARSRRRCSSRPPTAGPPITATTPASGTAGSPRSRRTTSRQLDAGVGVPDRADAADQGHADPGRTASSTSRRPTTSGRSTRAPARQLWHYTLSRRTTASTSAIAAPRSTRTSVYLTTPDAHLVALDAQDGTVKWNVVIADCEARATGRPTRRSSSAITCSSASRATSTTCPGMLQSFDPETGEDAVDVLQHASARHDRARRAAARPAGRCG